MCINMNECKKGFNASFSLDSGLKKSYKNVSWMSPVFFLHFLKLFPRPPFYGEEFLIINVNKLVFRLGKRWGENIFPLFSPLGCCINILCPVNILKGDY